MHGMRLPRFTLRDLLVSFVMFAVMFWSLWRVQEQERTVDRLEAQLRTAASDNRALHLRPRDELFGMKAWMLYWKDDSERVRDLAKKAGLDLPDYAPTPDSL